jgi:hypothetical protein
MNRTNEPQIACCSQEDVRDMLFISSFLSACKDRNLWLPSIHHYPGQSHCPIVQGVLRITIHMR